MQIAVKRIYDDPARNDGQRVLVDRVWPRGMTKEQAKVDYWARDVAPSSALRKWFGHDPARWEEFKRRYFAELDDNPAAVAALKEQMGTGRATLLFGSREERFNNARALKEYLQGD